MEINDLVQEMRRWLDEAGLSVREAYERLLPEHFQDRRVPNLRSFRTMLRGEKLTWDLVEAVTDVCFPEEIGAVAAQRRRAARALWDKAQADPTPLGEQNGSPRELLERTIRVYEELTQLQRAYHVSEQGRQRALQVATMLFALLGQAHAQVATLSRQVERALGTPSASGGLEVMRQRLERIQGQEAELREQLERAIRDRDRYQEVADRAARRIQALENALRRLGGQAQPVDAPAVPDVEPLGLATHVSDGALDALDATLDKVRDVLDREQEVVQEAADELGWTTTDRGFAEQHMTVVQGYVVRSSGDPTDSCPALASPGTAYRRSHGVKLPVRNSVPPRNPRFTGRERLLGALREALGTAGQTAACVLTGLGGLGKTQVAVEYVHQTLSEYDLVWWIPAESRDTVREHLAALAPALGIMTGSSHESRIHAVLAELSRHGGLRWLVVFDNADDPEGIRDLIPAGPGHVLITSRQPGWETRNRLPVPEYARQESIYYFQSRVPGLSTADANDLAEMLAGLPLAIAQAAAWLAETAMPAQEYIALFRQKVAELEDFVPSAKYPQSVSKAWAIAMNRLEHTRPQAVTLLKLGTFLDPSGIPLSLLHWVADAAWKTGPEALRESLEELQRYSLVRIDLERSEGGEDTSGAGFMRMHRLVQGVVRDRLSKDEQRTLSGLARKALAMADPGNPSDPEQWPTYAELIPHLDASGALDSDEPGLDTFRRNCLRYLYVTRG